MDNHINKITHAFSDLVRSFNKFQLSDHTLETIKNGNSIIEDGTKLLEVLKHYTNAIESVINDCNEYIDEITEDLSHKKPPEDFVYSTSHGMLSYNGRDYIDKFMSSRKEIPVLAKPIGDINKSPKLKNDQPPVLPPGIHINKQPCVHDSHGEKKRTSKTPHVNQPNIRQYEYKKQKIEEVGYYMDFPTVSNFSDISPMFYYYDNPNDKINEPGIYCSIIQGVIIKIPFPVIVDSTREYSRGRSIKCKYEKRSVCDENRDSMAKRYNSELRKCNFAHEGEDIVKIGYPSRCSTMPRFGNASTLTKDINIVKISDIKNVLLYGLNDVIVSAIWFYHHKQRPGVYSRVDVA